MGAQVNVLLWVITVIVVIILIKDVILPLVGF